MAEPALNRLTRLLAMVPWLLRHQGVSLTAAAQYFEITQEQLIQDLELLFVCGLPGHLPDDLIDAEWETGHIYLGNAASIAQPLRLSTDEAAALLVALQALAEVPGIGDRAAVTSALAKLQEATGAATMDDCLRIDVQPAQQPAILRCCEQSLREQRRLRLEYLVPHRDHVTAREVDPIALVHSEGQWYLSGWCHRAEAARTFRIDRILTATILDQPGIAPTDLPKPELTGRLFTPAATDQLVQLRTTPSARWLVDYYPVEDWTEVGAGQLEISLRTADLDWLIALVLRLGGQCEVLHPAAVRDRIQHSAAQALAQYGSGNSAIATRNQTAE